MRLAFIGGFAFRPKGTMRARAHPLAAELVRGGHEVTIFLPPYDNLDDCGREWQSEGVRIRNVGTVSNGRMWSSGTLRHSRMLAELISEVRGYQPGLIHVFKPKGFAGAAGSYFLLRTSIPVVVDCDDWEGWGGWNDLKPYPWLVKEYIDRQERWLIRKADAVTVASRTLEDRVRTMRGNEKGIGYVPNCGPSAADQTTLERVLHRDRAQVRRELGLPDAPLIFFSGHSEHRDEQELFCRVAAQVAGESGAAVVVIGREAEYATVRETLRSAYPNVPFLLRPRCSYQEFLLTVHACDAAIFPYPDDLIHRAKCSARIVDYMLMRKPVLTSAVGQNLEYIVDGESGLLARPGDESDLAAKLRRVLTDAEFAQWIGANARVRITTKFRWSQGPLRACMCAYESALARHHQSSGTAETHNAAA